LYFFFLKKKIQKSFKTFFAILKIIFRNWKLFFFEKKNNFQKLFFFEKKII